MFKKSSDFLSPAVGACPLQFYTPANIYFGRLGGGGTLKCTKYTSESDIPELKIFQVHRNNLIKFSFSVLSTCKSPL